MKEEFLKTVNTILDHNGACNEILCKECPFLFKYNGIVGSCEDAKISTPGSDARDPDPVLVESCKKWKRENGYED